MAMAIVMFGNQANFGSTDHISSAWLHSTPILTVWAIRWKEIIYSEEVLNTLHFNLLTAKDMLLTSMDERVQLLLITPLLFWCAWVVYYVIVFYIGCNSLINDERYQSGLDDFKGMAKKSAAVFGDPE